MDLLRLGKKILFFTFAVLAGLIISLQILQAHSKPEEDAMGIDEEATSSVLNQVSNVYAQSMEDRQGWVPIMSEEAEEALKSCLRRGRPFAYLAQKQLYVIDDNGNILAPAFSMPHTDMPVITGSALKFDVQAKKLRGAPAEDALALLKYIEKYSGILAGTVSEVHVDQKTGLVVYLNWQRPIPIIMGRGDMERKVKRLDVFFDQLADSGILDRTKYLDARFDGQIIMKKNS